MEVPWAPEAGTGVQSGTVAGLRSLFSKPWAVTSPSTCRHKQDQDTRALAWAGVGCRKVDPRTNPYAMGQPGEGQAWRFLQADVIHLRSTHLWGTSCVADRPSCQAPRGKEMQSGVSPLPRDGGAPINSPKCPEPRPSPDARETPWSGGMDHASLSAHPRLQGHSRALPQWLSICAHGSPRQGLCLLTHTLNSQPGCEGARVPRFA